MLEQDITARLSATIEEELGSFRLLAGAPSTDIEEMAARIARAIEPFVSSGDKKEIDRAA